MSGPYLTEPRTKAIGLVVLLIGIAILSYTNKWWPGLMIVIGISVAVKQTLRKKYYDAVLALIIFGGVAVTTGYNIGSKYFLPVILMVSSIYILFRAFFMKDQETEIEREEEQNKEIEEDDEDTKS